MFDYIVRMSPFTRHSRIRAQATLNDETVDRAQRAIDRRMDLIKAEARVRATPPRGLKQ